jgi:hypothetical protein
MNPYEHFALTWKRARNVQDLQHLWSAGAGDYGGAHE